MKICPQCQTPFPDDIDFCSNDGMKLRMQREEQADPMLGKVLDGRWIIDSKLGEGGMGSVYLGRQRSVNRAVAIKTLRPELVTNTEFVDRFFREAQIATTINHPNCVTILDFGQTEDDLLFLAMEYLEGIPLADRLEKEIPLTLDEVLTIGDEIAAALEAAHSHGIVHRDLKPDNVFLQKTPNGGTHSKLLDFGIAKDSNASTQFTRTGQIFGTPDYMSPEQCSGGDLDGRSDLYSLGCIFYEMLCGHPPFENTNSMAILMAHVTERPRPLSELTSLPLAVEQLVLRLLSKDPNARHADANALRQDLIKVRASLITQGTSQQPVITTPRAPVETDAFADTMAGAALVTPAPMTRTPTASIPEHDDTYDLPVTSSSKAPLLIIAVIILGLLGGGSVLAISLFNSQQPSEVASQTPPPLTAKTSPANDIKQETPPIKETPPPVVTPDPIVKEDVAVVAPKDDALDFEDVAKQAPDKKEPTKPVAAIKKKEPTPAKSVSSPPKQIPKTTTTSSSDKKEPDDRSNKKSSPASNSIPGLPKIEKELPKIEKKIKTKSDQIVNDLFK